MKLKYKQFTDEEDLVEFVNSIGLKKENIQTILRFDCFILFYWGE